VNTTLDQEEFEGSNLFSGGLLVRGDGLDSAPHLCYRELRKSGELTQADTRVKRDWGGRDARPGEPGSGSQRADHGGPIANRCLNRRS
jgi:hypothetical protein